MKVQDMYTYPVKSLGGIRIQTSEALQKGFRYDRRWMLVDEDGKFISQRTEHRLALFQSQISDHCLIVGNKINPGEQISIPLVFDALNAVSVSIWDDRTEGFLVSEEVDEWFTEQLRKPCRLVFFPEDGRRPVDSRFAENAEQVSFADAFPYLLITQASLDDLNSRLEVPVPMDRFRPNIVISGTDPYAEDTWNEIQIGEVRFKVAKPCARCVLTTVDQKTGIKGKEPLFTLSRYRSINNKVLFGQNLIALNEGWINLDDAVRVLK